MKEARYKRPLTVCFHLYECPEEANSQRQRLAVATNLWEGKMGSA